MKKVDTTPYIIRGQALTQIAYSGHQLDELLDMLKKDAFEQTSHPFFPNEHSDELHQYWHVYSAPFVSTDCDFVRAFRPAKESGDGISYITLQCTPPLGLVSISFYGRVAITKSGKIERPVSFLLMVDMLTKIFLMGNIHYLDFLTNLPLKGGSSEYHKVVRIDCHGDWSYPSNRTGSTMVAQRIFWQEGSADQCRTKQMARRSKPETRLWPTTDNKEKD